MTRKEHDLLLKMLDLQGQITEAIDEFLRLVEDPVADQAADLDAPTALSVVRA